MFDQVVRTALDTHEEPASQQVSEDAKVARQERLKMIKVRHLERSVMIPPSAVCPSCGDEYRGDDPERWLSQHRNFSNLCRKSKPVQLREDIDWLIAQVERLSD